MKLCANAVSEGTCQSKRGTHGKGAVIVVNPANRAVAPTVPSRWYIWPAKSGNAAAKVVRTNVLAAIDEAATGRKAVTRYVQVEV